MRAHVYSSIFLGKKIADSATHVAQEQRNKALLHNRSLSCSKECTMKLTMLIVAILALLFTVCRAKDGIHRAHFDENYLVGMRAYTLDEWSTCTERMQQAVSDFENYQKSSVKCLKQCENQPVSTL